MSTNNATPPTNVLAVHAWTSEWARLIHLCRNFAISHHCALVSLYISAFSHLSPFYFGTLGTAELNNTISVITFLRGITKSFQCIAAINYASHNTNCFRYHQSGGA